MSRSRKTTPVIGWTTAATDKPWKQQHARRLRRAVHQLLDQTADADTVPTSRYAKGHCGCEGMKDGKQWLATPTPKDLRK